MAQPGFKEWIWSLVEPSTLLGSSAYYFVVVVLEKVLRGDLLAPVLRVSQLREESFSRFWINFSGARAANQAAQAELVGSSALVPPLLVQANGVVLDIGPGTGTQTHLFTNKDLKTMYGAEPCTQLHSDLNAKITACGLADKYRILSCGAEPHSLIPALRKAGFTASEMQAGIFDTICCVRVLCSVPNPEQTIRGLYDLLKPGGKLLVCEHVVNPWMTGKGNVFGRLAQAVYMTLGFPFFMGGCRMTRDTAGMLRKVANPDGGWATVDLEKSFGWGPLPYVSGTLVKRG